MYNNFQTSNLAKYGLLAVIGLNFLLSLASFVCLFVQSPELQKVCSDYKFHSTWINLILAVIILGLYGVQIFPGKPF